MIWGALALSLTGICLGQIVPEDAQVDLYFPHLADGKGGQTWQTRFTFVNPSTTTAAEVTLFTYSDDGSAWALDLGSGAKTEQDFFVPPQGRVTLASSIGPQFKTGWALGFSDIPLQATAAFREFSGSTTILDLTAPATLPSQLYRSAANKNLGIALANQYNAPMGVTVTAFDQGGHALQSAQVTLPADGHSSFNLGQLMPSLPSNFLGSIVMEPVNAAWQFLGWTANEDSGALSTLPPGRAEWPISHLDRIWLVYLRVLDVARQQYPQVNFDGPQGLARAAVQLQTPATWVNPSNGQQQFNASSAYSGVLLIPLSTSELISDSESEIAWIVAHELGHQIQYRLGATTPKLQYVPSNLESDADVYGLILSLSAGFDPYAAAGALAKLAMGMGQAGVNAQSTQDFDVSIGAAGPDPHPSYGTRIDNLWSDLNLVCGSSSGAQICANYKSLIHPNFPPQTPLDRPARHNVTPGALDRRDIE